MTKALYVGVDEIARKVNKIYVGVDDFARKVKKALIQYNWDKSKLNEIRKDLGVKPLRGYKL